MYNIEYLSSARKDLKQMDPQWRKKVILAIDRLSANPFASAQVKKLVNSSYYRLRVGNYRIVFDVKAKKLVVLVIHIKQRGAIYKKGRL